MKRLLKLTALLTSVSLSATVAAQDFVITNATVATGDGSAPIENGVVIVEDGRVTYAGPASGVQRFETDTVYDVTGKWVTAGIFSPVTTLGLWDVGAVSDSNDQGASNAPFSAALDVSTALNPASQHVKVNRAGGVTRASIFSQPTASIFGGQGAIVDLGNDNQMVMKPRAFQMVALGEYGARVAGGSRTASHALLKTALEEAQSIARGGSSEGADIMSNSDVLLSRFDAKSLVPVVRGEQALYVAVERASDIRQVLALKNQFSRLDLVLLGVSEGWLAADEIAAAGVPVIADPLDDLPSSFEQLAATQSNVGRMVAAGVKVALGGLTNGIEQPRNATQYAGNLVALQKIPGASGLSWGQAFASITSVPAEISGYGGRLGVLAPGAAGDLVIWDGDPLELSSTAERVFIDGVEQPLESHQTRLRDRYRDLDESDLPKAYDW